ncbi:metallophosphoesterase [Taibaiella koreensis]|uniref:metallophosphoesterase n=1 Tax=Taibaiella koreensis TaxID=1268548 RepID=UPI000E59F3C7|nr:metallophosphoesterase [Taibaiella koreensis]
MREFVMGDIHGAHKAMVQCLERSGFDFENDLLIQVGDIVDGYPEAFECVEELLKVKNLIAIKGNHDDWFCEFNQTDFHPRYWTYGGKGTLISYLKIAGKEGIYFASGSGFKTALVASDIPYSHKKLFSEQQPYHIDKKKRCFVHGGFKRHIPFAQQEPTDFYWDRTLWTDALKSKENGVKSEAFEIATKFKEIYVGHTPTTKLGKDKPLKKYNIINMDTGAGHQGRLTIMDINSKEFWQSDPVSTLYPENYRDSA